MISDFRRWIRLVEECDALRTVAEAVRRIEVPSMNSEIVVWSDLTKNAIIALAGKHDVRGIATAKHVWLWDALSATHDAMARAIGVTHGCYVYISGKAHTDVSEWRTSPRYVIAPPVYCYYGMTGDPMQTQLGYFLSDEHDDDEE